MRSRPAWISAIIAGYQDLTDPVVTQQRLLVTAAETLARYPGTVAAATVAHIRALEDLGDPKRAADFLDRAVRSGFVVTDAERAAWPAQADAFRPFDGGFGDPTADGGITALRGAMNTTAGQVMDPAPLISVETLWAAQGSLDLPLNPPVSGIFGPPPTPSTEPGSSLMAPCDAPSGQPQPSSPP